MLEDVDLKQIVSIYGCKNSVIQIKGKVNAISLSASPPARGSSPLLLLLLLL